MIEASVARRAGSEIRWAGVVCCVAGLIGAAASINLGLASPPAMGGGLVFPHGASEFLGLQMIIALSHAGFIFGLLGLWWSGVVPDTRSARVGLFTAVVLVAVLAPTAGVAVSVPMSPRDGTPSALSVVFVGYTVLLGVALLVAGAGVVRNAVWRRWMRWLPLGLGSWLLAIVVPALLVSFTAARWATAGWLLLTSLVGFVLTQDDRVAPAGHDRGNRGGPGSGRTAAILTWVYAAAFAGPVPANVAFLLQNGRLPWFLDVFTMYGGPWLDGAAESTVVILLLGYLLVASAAAWVAWLVWNGSKQGVLLSLALLPVEAAFWLGFSLPIPWVFGIARAVLLIRRLRLTATP